LFVFSENPSLPSAGRPIKDAHRQQLTFREDYSTPLKLAFARSNSPRNSTSKRTIRSQEGMPSVFRVVVVEGPLPKNLCYSVVEQSKRHGFLS
jgi:hypothetical protein